MSVPSLSAPTLSVPGPGQQRIVQTCTMGEQSAEGAVTHRQAGSEDSAPAHLGLAGARACSALAEKLLAAGNAEAAVAVVNQGSDALGADYAAEGTKDSTELKWMLADERIQDGALADGAQSLLRVLQSRIAMYAEQHQAELVD